MPKTIVALGDLVFDKTRREQAFGSAVNRTTVQFAVSTAKKIVEEPKTGRLYRKKRGSTFRRSHRASAKGERPAVDSGKLLRSIKHEMTGPTTGEVTTRPPGFDYAEQLQDRMDRPIQSDADAKEAEGWLAENCQKALELK